MPQRQLLILCENAISINKANTYADLEPAILHNIENLRSTAYVVRTPDSALNPIEIVSRFLCGLFPQLTNFYFILQLPA